MGHNYAKPMTPEQKQARVLARVPPDWTLRIERPSGGQWRALMQPPGAEGAWCDEQPTLADALDAAWRLNRVAPT
ncbi:hypothetical protein AA103196_1476 [Ameyamaea chiangmaiensis NBRC 103196]|uniref:Uncharacterized protein n=1 Tax=Ameyamaea chiangmaiensis TaxID=442969 RepID=A0A850PAF9_9PROT|nr:hypothetical protein [Ameyamaea chiangmaiensis]MBS4075297.1 hypothetical protein [Ameyamaea chiangmaiensis]NVN41034.1 hypothetical protein [Ameyamaea chiangmaiensis]GBQ66682.1 hypothetical protein AA103196_1476 [Ameyamaea chiangmaiensis NBRC 103196]